MENEIYVNENENKKRSKREWVKTAAIIFLAVMLVLTFFSQTIMNWSLPEVSGQYAGWGEISTGIRGTGTVESNMAYNVKLEYSHLIKAINVRNGDYVEAGQVLAVLDESDSEELKAAKDTLEDLQYAYSSQLLSVIPADYTRTNQEIANMREDLQTAINDRSEISANYTALMDAKARVTAAQRDVDDLSEEVSYYEGLIAEGGSNADSSALDRATNALAVARAELTKATNDVSSIKNQIASLGNPNMTTLTSQLTTAENEYNAAKANYEASGSSDDQRIMNEKKAVYDLALANYNSGLALQDRINELAVKQNSAESAKTAAEEKVAQCEYELQVAQNNFNANSASYISSIETKLSRAKKDLREANEELSDANDALADASSKPTSLEEADANIKSLQRQIESMLAELAATQKSDGIASAQTDLELERARKNIEDQQKIVDKLSATGENAEVTSKYAGTVTNISYIAGDTVPAGDTLFEIEVDSKGYTLSLTVSNEQAKQVKVGDTASVTNWWGGDLALTLDAIKTDRNAPGKSKILEFTVEGSATPGQTLDIVVGDRKTSYEMVVPLSAVREDSNGNFILVAHAKNTPLGNRYIATRVDVTVIAKDTYNAAIDMGNTSGEYNYEFVITTATKPVDAGSQVRLVED